PAVISVKAGLDAIRWWKDRRDDFEVIWHSQIRAATQHIVRSTRKLEFGAEVTDSNPILIRSLDNIDCRKIVVQPTIRVDGYRFSPGGTAIQGLRHLNVIFAVAEILPCGIEMPVRFVDCNAWEVISSNKRAGNALFRAAPEIAQRFTDD